MDVQKRADTSDRHSERRPLRQHRKISLAQSLDETTRGVQSLSRAVAETNERHCRALAAFVEHVNAQSIERERAMVGTLHELLVILQQHTQGANEASEQQVRQIEHVVDRVRAQHDWAGVVREVVTQGGVLAQQLLCAQGRALQESPPREATPIELVAPRHEPPPTVAIPPSVGWSAAPHPQVDPASLQNGGADAGKEDSRFVGRTDSYEDSDFDAIFFGFSESETNPVQPCIPEHVNQSAAEESHSVPFAEVAGQPTLAPYPAPEAEAESAQPATVQAEPSPAVLQGLGALGAPLPEGGEAMDPAAMLDLLSRLMAQHAPKKEPPRPKEWSRAWAIQELKRRVLGLGEMGFLMTISQPRRLLLFLRELGEAIRPPDLRPLPAPG